MYVEFDDKHITPRAQQQVSRYAQTLMQLGLAQSVDAANRLLLILAFIFFLAAFFIWYSTAEAPTPADTLTLEEARQAGNPSEVAGN